MAKFTLVTGKRYQAALTLGWLEQIASNEQIAGEFAKAGFGDVTVEGSGDRRIAKGVWTRESMEVSLPEQVSDVVELA